MKTRFVLINTSHAGNVGAAARAMKVMGFDDLVLVAPRWDNVLRREETIQRASGAQDVLQHARIVASLDEALEDMTVVCATAMTARDFGPPTMSPRQFCTQWGESAARETAALEADAAAGGGGVAFLFGSERFGMRNEDVYRCHVALCIPANPAFGSLNLASAVQLIAYEWRLALGGFAAPALAPCAAGTGADAAQVAGLLAHWEQALVAVDYLNAEAPGKLIARLNQLFNRAALTQQEVHILRGIAKSMLQAASRSKG